MKKILNRLTITSPNYTAIESPSVECPIRDERPKNQFLVTCMRHTSDLSFRVLSQASGSILQNLTQPCGGCFKLPDPCFITHIVVDRTNYIRDC